MIDKHTQTSDYSNNQSSWRSHFGVPSVTELTIDSGIRFWVDSSVVLLAETLMTQYPRTSHHAWMLPLKSVAVGFCVFSLGSALAAWLTLHNVHGFLLFVDNFVAGIAAGLMVFLYERWRQREVDKKLRTIRLMNHHVRNALQIISAAASCSVDGTEQATRCQDAVRRIEWALREVLPGEIEPTDAAAPPKPGTPKKECAA